MIVTDYVLKCALVGKELRLNACPNLISLSLVTNTHFAYQIIALGTCASFIPSTRKTQPLLPFFLMKVSVLVLHPAQATLRPSC